MIDLPVETRFELYVVVHFSLLYIGGEPMIFKMISNLVHDILITAALVLSVVMIFNADPIGVIILLLAMIEDNAYKRR